MILAVQIDRAISIADLIPVKVRNSYTDIRHHAGGGVRRIEGRQHVGHGLAQNLKASRSLDRISHRTGGIQHEDHVHALAHGNAGGRQFDLGHAGILEIDALAGLFHTNRTLVGILGIVVQLCLIPHDHLIGNAAHRHRGSTCRKAFEGHRGAGRNSRRGGWVVVDRDVGGGIFPVCLLTDLGHTIRATSIAPSVSILFVTLTASLGIQMIIIAVISLIVVTSILPASVFFLNQCVTGDIGLRSGCLAVLPLRAADRNRDRRLIGARIRRIILAVNGLGSGLTDRQVNGLSRGLRRLGGTLGGQLIDIERSLIAFITINQPARIIVQAIASTRKCKAVLASSDGKCVAGRFQCSSNSSITSIGECYITRRSSDFPAVTVCCECPFFRAVITGDGVRTCNIGISHIKAHSGAAAIGFRYNLWQHKFICTCIINQQILLAALQFTGAGHSGIGPLRRRAAGGGRYLFAGRSDLLVQRQPIGRADSGGVGGILRVVGMLHVIDTGGLQIMGAIGRVAADGDIIVRDGEGGHGQRLVHIAGVRVTVVAHIAGIQIGEGQRFFLKLGRAALGNVDLIALGQEDGSAAQIVIPAVRMVVAEHEDDVQAGIARLVQHIKDVIGVHAVTAALTGTHRIMQRQMGNNEDRLGVFCVALAVEIAFQIIGGIFDGGFIVIIPHVILLVDDIYAVRIRIMGAAFGQSAAHKGIVVMVALHIHFVHAGAVDALNRVLERRLTAGRIVVIDIIVAAEQEAVGFRIVGLLHLGQNVGYRLRSGCMTASCLEIRAGDHNRRITARGKYTCRQQ